MPAKLTTEQFIEKARAVHGGRYDYSQVEYRGSKNYVTILCPDHGAFEQRPNGHLSKQGCPDCAGTSKATTRSFIKKAKQQHGDFYDYSQVIYVNNRTKVKIVCPDHGPFSPTPQNHISRKSGCPVCAVIAVANSIRRTRDQFIENAIAVHGNRYDYSKVEYLGKDIKVTIICPDHGTFDQTPGSHLQKKGCPFCGGTKKLSTEGFIDRARAVHGDRYDYSLVDYVNNRRKVTIICRDHGRFRQTPDSHMAGTGCPDCSGKKKRNTGSFIIKSKEVHGNQYDYSAVDYVIAHTKVIIICPDHGPFEQKPSDHINSKAGCPDCAETGFNPSEPGILYYVGITTDNGDTRYKIGITNTTVERRFRPTDRARIRIVKTWRFAIGRAAAEREAEILRQYAGDRYYGPNILVGPGNTELFTHDVLGLDK